MHNCRSSMIRLSDSSRICFTIVSSRLGYASSASRIKANAKVWRTLKSLRNAWTQSVSFCDPQVIEETCSERKILTQHVRLEVLLALCRQRHRAPKQFHLASPRCNHTSPSWCNHVKATHGPWVLEGYDVGLCKTELCIDMED